MAWSSQNYGKNGTFNWDNANASRLLELFNGQPHEHVLDLGCGSGEYTLKHVAPISASVVGLDSSPDLIEAANKNLQASTTSVSHNKQITFVLADALQAAEAISQLEDGSGTATRGFDAAISNAALHWMKDRPEDVARQVFQLLKPGGRFVAEFGGFMNTGGMRGALHRKLRSRGVDPVPIDPWYFPSEADYKAVLESAGFRVDLVELQPRQTHLPLGLSGWLKTFAFHFLQALPQEEQQKVINEICEEFEIDCRDGRGEWYMMYCRLRFVAVKTEEL